jgi:hypothetical protein
MKPRKRINKSNPFLIKKKDDLESYLVYAKARAPIPLRAKDLVSVIKKSLEILTSDDILEIHDEYSNLIWGKNTGIEKAYYENKKAKS